MTKSSPRWVAFFCAALVLHCVTTVAIGQTVAQAEAVATDPASIEQPVMETITQPEVKATDETLTRQWFGWGEKLSDQGIEVVLGLTQVHQHNVRGGLATNRRSGRYAGSYELEIGLDLEKLLGIQGGSVYMLAEGGWSDGINENSVGALAGVNARARGYRAIDLTEFWYQQALADDHLFLRLGKLDLTTTFEHGGTAMAFDGNRYANDEVGQFINEALVNNLSIPFPEQGLGMMIMVQGRGLYLAAGGADALADARTTGFNTAFHGPDHFFGILEGGLVTALPSPSGELPGTYRLGMWYDPQPKTHFVTGRTVRDDVGLYVSIDQMFYRTSAEDDEQGLGGFLRYGLADGNVNDIRIFWSLGLSYTGIIPGRHDDTFGAGMAQSRVSRRAGYTANHETIMELYYSTRVRPWMYITPHLQYIRNPGGLSEVSPATVLGLRVQITF